MITEEELKEGEKQALHCVNYPAFDTIFTAREQLNAKQILALIQEVRRLQSAYRVLEKANEFYASEERWHRDAAIQFDCQMAIIDDDDGDTAREARDEAKKILEDE